MDLDALRAFIAVADTGSFSQAARSLDSALTTLKRRVDDLEAGAGAELLKRAADSVRTTRAGEVLADKGRAVLRETKNVIEAVRALDLHNKLLTIEVPLGLPPTVEQAAHRTLRKAVPSLRLRVLYNTGAFNHDTDASFVLHHGSNRTDEPARDAGAQELHSNDGWFHTKVAKLNVGLSASRSYLETYGAPHTLDELVEHNFLVWERSDRDPNILPCASRPEGLQILPVLLSSSANLIRRFAQADQGIAYAPNLRVLKFMDEKDPLVRILEKEVFDQFELWMAVRNAEKGSPIGVLGQALARLIRSMYLVPFS